mmetsp:Transcript_21823/g.51769  ORF Transcript_21823/g.51769 Transcript_21823/m.51769 type:complete len:249 (+) Transcript_21823:122-868(+)
MRCNKELCRSILLHCCLAVKKLAHQIFGNLFLPFVSVGKELFLVVQEFLVGFGCEFVVWTLHNGIDGTRLLAESAVDALGHIDIVTSGSTSTVFTGFGLDSDGLGGADCLTEFARDTAFISGGVSSKGVLPAESGTQVTSLVGVVDSHLWFQTDFQGERESTGNFGQEENLRGSVEDCFPRSRKDIVIIDIGIFGRRGTRRGGQGSERNSCWPSTGTDKAETSVCRQPKQCLCRNHPVARLKEMKSIS